MKDNEELIAAALAHLDLVYYTVLEIDKTGYSISNQFVLKHLWEIMNDLRNEEKK